MSETLYGVLGVGPDCDSAAIERAYREQVKEHHPDVSDATDAGDRFRRLTTAKEVLTDETERARYDRLGHDRYVGRHLDDSWRSDATGAGDVGATGDGVSATEAPQRVVSETASAAEPRQSQRVDRSDGYATASDYYRPGHRVGVQSGGLGDTLAGVRDVLPWLLAHLALLGGAVAMAAALLTSAGGAPSVTTVVVAAVMVGATAGVSALHLTAALFR
ncbi:DnaJ domain-containing protein [Haloarcula onubensis]|uniref:DnaJ domain-containing protein n=1 Tax=Haloarcula onubensis TaxID=2950539 RepID=A0ABU2FSS6_9EURY|nr:DnaJ domain-containing protein [Halomicroarcula sp. S3CR25-11]MDS0283301.1 DnaJ domain-containing protein [Halomicroarcula sp. S3CR25-11]